MKGLSNKSKLTTDDLELTLLALPTFIWFIVFAYIPMIGVVLAFKRYQISSKGFLSNLFQSEWVGFNNFKFLFATNDIFIILRNTVLYNFTFIILDIVVPVTLAILLSEIWNKKAAKFYQTAMFLPHFLSWVVISYFAYAFLSQEKGYMNSLLQTFGANPVNWYNEAKYWPYIIVFMHLWKSMGYGTVIYLASIAGIDKTYYEAAIIDGASKWYQIKYVTLPLLKPVMVVMLILSIGRIFNADFGLFYQLPKDSGAIYSVTNVIDTYVYRAMMGTGEIGMSAAAALFQSVVGCLMLILSNLLVRKIDNENSLF